MKVSIYRNPIGGADIYISNEINGRVWLAKTVQLEFEDITEKISGRVEPTISFPTIIGEMFLKAFGDALSGLDIKVDSQHKLEGILEATKFHLDDCRKLIGLKKK